jgi:hypothetical protein
MIKYLKPAFIAAAVTVCVAADAAPVFAHPSEHWGHPHGREAPGPLAGVGLPFLIVAGAVGGYKLIRRRWTKSGGRTGQE